jgi:hypothetical protein
LFNTPYIAVTAPDMEDDCKFVGAGPAQLVWYMGYGLDNQGTRVQFLEGSRDFSSPQHPDQLQDPSGLPSNGYQWLFSRK